jgi:hypothetical protein
MSAVARLMIDRGPQTIAIDSFTVRQKGIGNSGNVGEHPSGSRPGFQDRAGDGSISSTSASSGLHRPLQKATRPLK